MGRVRIDRRVSKKSNITSIKLTKIKNKIEELLIEKEPKPRTKWQKKIGCNGDQYHVFLKEQDGLVLITQVTPARSRAKYGVKKQYTAENSKKYKKGGVRE